MTAHKEGCLIDGQAPDLMQYDSQHSQIQCQIYHAVINECPYMRVLHNPPTTNCENPECDIQTCNTQSSREELGTINRSSKFEPPQLLQDSSVYSSRTFVGNEPPVYYKYKYSDENVDVSA